MRSMKVCPVVVIGDVVGSRDADDRAALHRRLEAVLEEANQRWDAGLRITVGDEFQGSVASLGAALGLTLALRVAMLPRYDLRHGIGRGETAVLDPDNRIEDGPGWWAARAAIESVKALAARSATGGARTAYRTAEALGEPTAAVDAALLGRDVLVGGLDARSLSVLRARMAGRTQRQVADDENVSPSAISQRIRHDGIGTVLKMSQWLEELP